MTVLFVRSSDETWDSDDLYIATRPDTTLPFDSVRALSEINLPDSPDAYPWISPDGLRLYYTRGNGRLFVSQRASTNDLFSTPSLVTFNITDTLNSILSSWLTADELQIYYITSYPNYHFFHATRLTIKDPFTEPELCTGFSNYSFITAPSIYNHELYLCSIAESESDSYILVFNKDTVSTDINHDNISQEIQLKRHFLFQNYPNPFNPTTTISYFIEKSGFVSLKIYDVLGRDVKTLVDEYQHSGKYQLEFESIRLASGLYFYKLQIGNDYIKVRKMLLWR
jgi:hypothetical protein